MSSANIEALVPLIDKVFEDIRSRILGIEKGAICDYVTQTITAESKLLLSSFYAKLENETLNSEPFLTTRNKNKFYDKDIRGIIFGRYNFSSTENIDYRQANEHYASLPVPAGTAVLGVVLAIALHQPVVLPFALVVAAGLYYVISKEGKNKKQDELKNAIDRYLESVKAGLITWFTEIEKFYNEQVDELKRSM